MTFLYPTWHICDFWFGQVWKVRGGSVRTGETSNTQSYKIDHEWELCSCFRQKKRRNISMCSVPVIDDSVRPRQKCTIENNWYSYISNINIINHQTSTLLPRHYNYRATPFFFLQTVELIKNWKYFWQTWLRQWEVGRHVVFSIKRLFQRNFGRWWSFS